MSNSLPPHRRQPTRLPCPWDSPGKNTGVGCHFLLQCIKVKVKSLSHVQHLATPWTAAHQAPLSMGFSRQEYWSGMPLPSLTHAYTCVYFLNFQIIKNKTTIWSGGPTSGYIYQRHEISVCTPMFFASLFTIPRYGNSLSVPWWEDACGIDLSISVSMMGHYSILERDKILPFATTWMNWKILH